jgi:hypothetical protein
VEAPPAVLPAGLHRPTADVRELGTKVVLAHVVRVRRQLDSVGRRCLLEALREQLEQPRSYFLRPLGGNGDDDAAEGAVQRNALFSFSKKPSSAR